MARARSRSVRQNPIVVLAPDPARRVGERRDTAIALLPSNPRSVRRVRDAPAGYLLCHAAADVARHCRLLDPLPDPGEIRLAVTPAPVGWHVDLAARDRPGLLAATSGVLATHGLDIRQAVIATWRDGAALQAFTVDADLAPDPLRLVPDFERALGDILVAPAVPDARVVFDDDASPWYTRCDVSTSDWPGLFHALAVAIAHSGADVHAARATTSTTGEVLDRFDLTDRFGSKLGPEVQDRIRRRVHAGLAPSRLRP